MSAVLLSDLSNSRNLKLALVSPGERPEAVSSYHCASLENFDSAIEAFMRAHHNPTLMAVAVSASGWEVHGNFSMPNHGFHLNRQHLRDILKIQRVHMVNDCVSKAMAIDRLRSDERAKVCGGEGEDGQVRVLIGSGRGLGMAGIVQDDLGQTSVLPCEGGHADLATTTVREAAVFAQLERKYGHVSRERVVSLNGLSELHSILRQLDDATDAGPLPPGAVVDMARDGNARALEAVRLSQGFLAAMTADAALMLGARGGVYLAGEYVQLISDLIDWETFATRFSDKGRLSGYMRDIPVYLVKAPDLELIGLTTLFERG